MKLLLHIKTYHLSTTKYEMTSVDYVVYYYFKQHHTTENFLTGKIVPYSTRVKFIKYSSHSYVPLQSLVGNIQEIYSMFGMILITTITSATNYQREQKFVHKERSNLSQ
jgi:hypothetical protein